LPPVSKLSKSEAALLRRQLAKRQQRAEQEQLARYNEEQTQKAKASKKSDPQESAAYRLLTPAQRLSLILEEYKLPEIPGETEQDSRCRLGSEIGRLEGLIGPNDVKPGVEYSSDQERSDCATRWIVLLGLPLIQGEDIIDSETRIAVAHCKRGHPDWNTRQSKFEESLYNDKHCPCTFQIPRRGFRGPEPFTSQYWAERDRARTETANS
jgi:hypothetical protein